MKSLSPHYPELLAHCEAIPIVDTHDHATRLGPRYTDPVQVVVGEYLLTDLACVTSEADARQLLDSSVPWRERWPTLQRAWELSCHTGYAQVTRRVLKRFYDEDEVTLAALERMEDRLLNLEDTAVFESILAEANIVVRLEDVWPDVGQVLDGTYQLTPRGKLVIPLPGYHRLCSFQEIQANVAPLGITVTRLDDYVDACRTIFEGFKRFGAVAFKDQSAYFRPLAYTNPTRAEAEAIFNRLIADPLHTAAYPDGIKPLDDYLFHQFLTMARDLDLPVQIHTGHMAGLYGDVRQSNAIQLVHLLLQHRDVRFDLFHANWPYAGEFLYLGKSFPNVALNFCWAHIIDPLYCQNLLRQVISAVPHGKIHGFGADFGGFGYEPGGGYADRAWAHAQIACENIAIALADMVDAGFLGLGDAKMVARSWLHENPARFYQLDEPFYSSRTRDVDSNA